MALKKSVTNRPSRQKRGYIPRLPHPSWHLSAAGMDGNAPVDNARDFWDRLGL